MNSSQTAAATYKYDPFGTTLAQSGTLASANVYRFSSKEFHLASGLYYYGFRFYDPNLQRWLNRDPIGELGGVNLYCNAANNPINRFDSLGLFDGNCSNEAFFGKNWKQWTQNMIQMLRAMPDPLPSPPDNINNTFGALWHYFNNFGSPAVIGPGLSQDLQNLQKCRNWPKAVDPTNLRVNDYFSWSYPLASLNVWLTMGQLRYTDDGTNTQIFDFYDFPWSNQNWDTDGPSFQNRLLSILLGPYGTGYSLTGQWPTAIK